MNHPLEDIRVNQGLKNSQSMGWTPYWGPDGSGVEGDNVQVSVGIPQEIVGQAEEGTLCL